MVAFTEKKQGLHDIIAKTLVIQSKYEGEFFNDSDTKIEKHECL